MMRKLLTSLLLLISSICFGQITGDMLIEAGLDAVKTDISKAFNKAQMGLELGYYISRDLALTAGFEIWSDSPESLLVGARYALNDKIYFKGKGLIGANRLALGGGYSFFFSETVRFNSGMEIYHTGELAIRLSTMWTIRRNKGSE